MFFLPPVDPIPTISTANELPYASVLGGAVQPVEQAEVRVTNQTGRQVYVHIGSTLKVALRPDETRWISVEPGMHHYRISAPGADPVTGERDFEDGAHYRWAFGMNTESRTLIRVPLSAMSNPQNSDLRADIDALRSELRADKRQIDLDRTNLDRRRADWGADRQRIETRRETLDTTDTLAVADFNSFVRHVNDESGRVQQSQDTLNAQIDAYNAKQHLLERKLRELSDRG